ncbi:hypothetical protein F4819DRAFT_492741 [Hypoxylon fuscum]|nr:hypothetical protein F4819DRAFT_492741 [Hypoxylon fuscum]
MAVFRQSHERLYGGAKELLEMLQTYWYGGEHVMKAMLEAGFDGSGIRVDRYSTKVRIEDARRWCEIGWSICGKLKEGWTQEDEDTWDDAIRLAKESLITEPWYQRDEDNENRGWLNLTASAILATK